MDLDTYAFSHNDAAAEQGNSSSAEGKGKQPVRDVDEQPASLEGDVRQLAQNVSSWWSGFAQKSQAQITQAQQRIASEGGLYNFAKTEAARLEAQLEDARQQAKRNKEQEDEVRRKELEADAHSRSAAQSEEVADQGSDSGDEEADDPKTPAQSRQKEQARQQTQEAQDAQDATSVFDADEASATPTPTIAASQTPSESTASTPAQTIFKRLQTLSSDPRVASLQKDLSSRLASSLSVINAHIPREQSAKVLQEGPASAAAVSKTVSNSLKELSSSLSAMSGAEAKSYAQKYLKASEDLIGQVGIEVKDLAAELVRVVPPPGQDEATAPQAAASASESERAGGPSEGVTSSGGSTQVDKDASQESNVAPASEEPFSWEEGDDASEAKSGAKEDGDNNKSAKSQDPAKSRPSEETQRLEASTRPPTGDFDGDASGSYDHSSKVVDDSNEGQTPAGQDKDDGSDSDSDWE